MKRFFDLLLASFFSVLLFPVMLMIALAIKLTSKYSVIYWSDRVGRHNVVFRMPKFRTMRTNTPVIATNLLPDPEKFFTPTGKFLRQFSLDELPQLWSILKGDMSFVGPRPIITNEHDRIALRTQYGVDALLPGLTGWAQINGRDELPTKQKVQLDMEYMQKQSFFFDCYILLLTCRKVLCREGITH